MITCGLCTREKPLGILGNGPAYAFGNMWLCEKHWLLEQNEEDIRTLKEAEGKLRTYKISQKVKARNWGLQ